MRTSYKMNCDNTRYEYYNIGIVLRLPIKVERQPLAGFFTPSGINPASYQATRSSFICGLLIQYGRIPSPLQETAMTPKRDNRRLGFYYYPDTLHYRESDLCKWLPVLQELGASWITLVTPVKRHTRILHQRFDQCRYQASLTYPCLILPSILSDHPCLDIYASWGCSICFLIDPTPVLHGSASAWAQNNLRERFRISTCPSHKIQSRQA
jgi:hypothetical protein